MKARLITFFFAYKFIMGQTLEERMKQSPNIIPTTTASQQPVNTLKNLSP